MIPGGERYAERLPANIERYLRLLERHEVRCTFFTVGNVARAYPDLVRRLVDGGHEIACHGSEHTTLDKHDAASFRRDVERCLEDFHRAGARRVSGFRAPCGSLVPSTAWAWQVVADMGFTYSSSIVPVKHPLFGWPDFPVPPTRVEAGIWEIPVTVGGPFKLPFAAGTYFRMLPFSLVRHLMRRRMDAGEPLVGYFHPYDIDTEQERFVHPLLDDKPLMNALMYVGRGRLLAQLERLFAEEDFEVVRYADYVEQLNAVTSVHNGNGVSPVSVLTG